MSRLSIIIPALTFEKQFEETLVSILENRPDDSEVIVVHNGPYDDPYDLQEEVRFVEVLADSSLLESLDAGLKASRAEVIHILACGTTVGECWVDSVLEQFDDLKVAAVSPLLIDSRKPKNFVSGVHYSSTGRRIKYRHRNSRKVSASNDCSAPTLTAAFYRKSALLRIGGFASKVGEVLADIDLALSLRALGYKTVVVAESKVALNRLEFISHGSFREGLYRERLFWRHLPNRNWLLPLMVHVLVIPIEILKGLPRARFIGNLLGRLVALKDIILCRRFYRQLRRSANEQVTNVKSADESLDAQQRSDLLRIDAKHRGLRSQNSQSMDIRQKIPSK